MHRAARLIVHADGPPTIGMDEAMATPLPVGYIDVICRDADRNCRAGAHATAVDNHDKLDFMRSLGADEVIDYRSEDFTRRGELYDVILDLVAHRSVADSGCSS